MDSIKIKDFEGSISTPYESGATVTLTEGEAHALNQTRKENIGNILRPQVNDGKIADHAAFVEALAAVDESYEFGKSGARGPRVVGLAAYVRDVGEALFKVWYSTKGKMQVEAKGGTLPKANSKNKTEREAYKALLDRFCKAKEAEIAAEAKARYEADQLAVSDEDEFEI